MKEKPVSHKSANIFKFETFNERLSKINLSTLRHFERGQDTLEVTTHFANCLEKWSDLNCTLDADALRSSIGDQLSVHSLAQVLHRKEELIEILFNVLRNPDNLALNVALELIVALARDIEAYFYPYFSDCLILLVDLLKCHDTEVLENIFMCLVYLFRILWKFILKEFKTVYELYATRLLTDQKDYIQAFAAESFAFVIRKSKSPAELLTIIFDSIQIESSLANGIGHLLFEVMRGVKNQLHSCCKTFLPLILKTYFATNSNENLRNAFLFVFELLIQNVDVEHSDIVWDSLCIDYCEKTSLPDLLLFLKVVTEGKKGKFIKNPEALSIYFRNLLTLSHTEQSYQLLLQCIASLFLNKYEDISRASFKKIISKVYNYDGFVLSTYNFTSKLFESEFFEMHVLDNVLLFVAKFLKLDLKDSEHFKVTLEFVVNLIIFKRPRPMYGEEISNYTKYSLNFAPENNICDVLLSLIHPKEKLNYNWYSLVCIPHIKPINDVTKVCQVISEYIFKLLKDNNIKSEVLYFIVGQAILTLIILKGRESPINELDINEMVPFLRLNSNHLHCLQAFDYLASVNFECDKSRLKDLHLNNLNFLLPNLMSSGQPQRIITLHIVKLVKHLNFERNSEEQTCVIDTCLRAELVQTTLSHYREKLLLLQKLEFCVTNEALELFPVRYLLGCLYENLSLLWQPILNLLEKFAMRFSKLSDFWNLIFSHYKETTRLMHKEEQIDSGDLNLLQPLSTIFIAQLTAFSRDSADHVNHRLLLLKVFEAFGDILEMRHREFVALFFELLENEIYQHEVLAIKKVENLSRRIDEVGRLKSNGKSRRMALKTFLNFLKIFSKFKNPKAMYRRADLTEIYLESLSHRDEEIQKAALSCLLTFNHNYLITYKDNLERLLDNKTFKNELTQLCLNSENEADRVLKDEHRADFMPILMRILFGKMLSQTGPKTSGKKNSQIRRSIVFRYLSGCSQAELQVFLDLAFKPINVFLSISYEDLEETIENLTDINKFIPISCLQSLTEILTLMVIHLGNVAPGLPRYLFRVLVVSFHLSNLLMIKRRDLIRDSLISRIRAVRVNQFKILKKFFKLFDTYPYSSDEIFALFSVLNPLLNSFHSEGTTSPTPLLKQFLAWSENPRFFVLFATSQAVLSPISVLMNIYSNPKTKIKVINVISQVVENLISLKDFSPYQHFDEFVDNLPCKFDVSENVESDRELNLGIKILFPYINLIVNRICRNFENTKDKKKANFTSQELFILKRLSEFTTDSEVCTKVTQLLLIVLSRMKNQNEESEVETLDTISALLPFSTSCEKFLPPLADLFGQMSNRLTRSALCKVLSCCDMQDELQKLFNLVVKLNSYNPKFPEQPDYPVRLKAFQSVRDIIVSFDEETVQNDFCLLIIRNCCFFIRSCDDLALRETSSKTLQTLVTKFGELDSKLFTTVIIKNFLFTEVRVGIQHKQEVVRHEFLTILAFLVKTQKDKHAVLTELFNLVEEDSEIDFWENIKHIQLHRRARALHRLTKTKLSISAQVILSFLFPIAKSFIEDQKYAKQAALIEAAISAIGTFCACLPWKRYEVLLKRYLQKLTKYDEHHKVTVKIVVSILDNFNYDLSNIVSSNEALNDSEKMNVENDIVKSSEENRKNVVTKEAANKIYSSMTGKFLPLLHNCLNQKSQSDFMHDQMKSEYPEDDEIQRVPIAIAMVKLMQNLPQKERLLSRQLPNIFLRLCHFLQSRAISIRQTARATFVKILQTLGSRFFAYALNELKGTLRKGYQVHVLTYTIHALLSGLIDQLNAGDLDKGFDSIIEICQIELFSDVAEEKDVGKITGKLKEAKTSKSYETYNILAQFASEASLGKLILPLKSILSETSSHKKVQKVVLCLQKIVFGLSDNKYLSEKQLLLFVYALIVDVPAFDPKVLREKADKSKAKVERTNSLLLKTEPDKRLRKVAKTGKGNDYIIAEHSLQLLLLLLKKNRLQPANNEHLSLLDPFIALLSKKLESNHPKTISISLRCLRIILAKFSCLPSLPPHSTQICHSLFFLLHKHGGAGLAQGANFELIKTCFKTMSLLIRDITCVNLDDEQIKTLVSYVEQDIYDNARQSTAFELMKSILSRKLQSLELHDIMTKIADMSIQAPQDHIRNQCRQLWLYYLLEYPLGKKLKNLILFFVRQLEYNHESGRRSAVEMLNAIVSSFPLFKLKGYLLLIFVPLSSRLLNEESTSCKTFVGQTLTKFLHRLEEPERTLLFTNVVLPWMEDLEPLKQQLGAMLCALFAEAEEAQFRSRLAKCLPLIAQQLDPTSQKEGDKAENKEPLSDHLLYHLLNALSKVIRSNNEVIRSPLFCEQISLIWRSIHENYILHGHLWVRLISSQLFGQLFACYSTEELASSITNPRDGNEYLLNDTRSKIWDLRKKFCLAFDHVYESSALGDQVMKNLIFMAKLSINLNEDEECGKYENEIEAEKRLGLMWLIKRLLRQAKQEIAKNPSLTDKRYHIFQWIGALCIELGSDLERYAETMLAPLCRELTDNNNLKLQEKSDLLLLAEQVVEIFKNVLGSEKFALLYSKVQSKITTKRLNRAKERAFLAVTDPVQDAKLKIARHARNKSRKRKLKSDKTKTLKSKRPRLSSKDV